MGQRGRPKKPRCEACGEILQGDGCAKCAPSATAAQPAQLVETVERPIPAPLTRADEYFALMLEELRAIRRGLAR